MTIGDLRRAINDPLLNDNSEVMVSIRAQSEDGFGLYDEIEMGVVDAAVSDVGKRVLLIVPEMTLWATHMTDGIEEGDE